MESVGCGLLGLGGASLPAPRHQVCSYVVKIQKDLASYSDYKVTVSYGQLIAIRDALTAAHAEPMADEILQEISFYLQNVPGPGESKEEFEAREDTGKGIEDAANGVGNEPPGEPGAPDEVGVPSAEGEEDFTDGPPPEGGEGGLPPGEEPGAEGADSPLPPPPAEDEEGANRSPVPPAPAE